MIGGFNQQVMLGMQHSAMLTQQFGGYAPSPLTQPVPTQGQNFANLMTMAGGQMGVNALQGSGSQNFLGGIPAGFAQFGLGQMMYGAQQQQMFQTQMQQAYRFPGQGGQRGFTPGQMQTMGADLRQMALQRGPGGEQTSFEELSQLASNMGRMGLAHGVRSAQEFGEKFREMLKTVKTIATEMGTGLEEAQKMMVSLKGAGIFRHQDQVAQMMRQGALAGNVSTSELSAAAMMGSQISRSIGGRGRAGAMAGMEALTRVGTAVQSGVLSEEDIYNTTGLEGAEGRQAFTQNMLGLEARFWKSGLGRRTLASIAGHGGKVDKSNVASYLAGGVGTGETMGMAHGQLGKIGRAEFLLNEGRLRGNAMEAFGGMGMATVARGWLEQRGLDPNSARGQLFLQRRFGLSRDDAENLGKMVEGLPMIQAERRMSQQNDELGRSLDLAARKGSPTEIIKKFEQARDKVNDKLRQFGADVNSQTANFLDDFFGKVTKSYEERVSRSLGPALAALRSGQGNTDDILAREMGLGSKASPLAKEAVAASRSFRGVGAGLGPISGQQLGGFLAQNFDALKEAGYDPTKITTAEQLQQIQREMRMKGKPELVGSLKQEGTFATREAEQFARGADLYRGMRINKAEDLNVLRDPLQQAGLFAGGANTKVGRGILGLERALSENVFDPLAKKQQELLAGGAAERWASSPRRGLVAGLGFLEGKARGGFGDERVTSWVGRDVAGRVGGALSSLFGGPAGLEARGAGLLQQAFGGVDAAQSRATTDFMDSDTGSDLMKSAFSSDAAVREAARAKRETRLQALRRKGDKELTASERGEMMGMEAIGATQAYLEFKQKNPGREPSESEWADIGKAGGGKGDPRKLVQFGVRSYGGMLDANQRQYMQESTKAASKELGLMNAQASSLDKLRKEGGLDADTDAYLQQARKLEEARVSAQSPEELAEIDKAAARNRENMLGGLSTKDKRERAAKLRGLEEKGVELTGAQRAMAEGLEARAATESRFSRAGAGGERGVAREVGRQLGVTLSAKDLRGGTAKSIQAIMEQTGLEGSEHEAELRRALKGVVAAKGPQEQAKLMEGIQQTYGKEFVQARKESQEKKAAAEDPNYRKMGEVKTSVDQVKEAVNTIGTNIVNAITKDAKPEGGKGGP